MYTGLNLKCFGYIMAEFGTKTRWLDDRLQANLAIFHNRVDNF